ncbi:ABC transporter ATP-binding protein [Falsiroseomonas oryzae]|uniref:ABC transporter ATP-binding protein n=1 Tax=Falsiroseomonas oryzae TaxID=2766473 RepID=UPI0022EA2976|nr:ABC transporter ATP-binding protein [Roseomonas sp. MO-31]
MATPLPASAAVEFDAVRLTYRTATGVLPAIEEVSLAAAPGSFVSILGPSGCGKSTLLKIAAGLLPPSAGRVQLAGEVVRGPRRDVGIVFQQPTLLPWQTVLDNVLVPARSQGLDMRAARSRAMDLIALVGLAGFEKAYPHELSGGMQQRAGLARAFVHEPAVLLMDEPFAALDALNRERMALELLEFWSRSRRTVLFVTHGIQEAVFLSDRVVVLSNRPARVVEDIAIPLPRPRTLDTMLMPDFTLLCDRLRRNLFAASGAAGRA